MQVKELIQIVYAAELIHEESWVEETEKYTMSRREAVDKAFQIITKDGAKVTRTSEINLVDLAGSERAESTGALMRPPQPRPRLRPCLRPCCAC